MVGRANTSAFSFASARLLSIICHQAQFVGALQFSAVKRCLKKKFLLLVIVSG